jgi:hypothetical protein
MGERCRRKQMRRTPSTREKEGVTRVGAGVEMA